MASEHGSNASSTSSLALLPDSSAHSLLDSLPGFPLPEVSEYVRAMYMESFLTEESQHSLNKVAFLIGADSSDTWFNIYILPAALRDASPLFERSGRRSRSRRSSTPPPSPGSLCCRFREQDCQAAVVFGLWLGLYSTADAELYEGFDNVIQCKFGQKPDLFVRCWDVADRFEAQPFKNYLTTTAVVMSNTCLVAHFGIADNFSRAGLSRTSLVGALLDSLAFQVVETDMVLLEVLESWSVYSGLMGASPRLLAEFLLAIEDLKGFRDRFFPFHPRDRLCAKWHTHKSRAERRACPDFNAVQCAGLDSSDDDQRDDSGDDGGDDHEGDSDNGDDEGDDRDNDEDDLDDESVDREQDSNNNSDDDDRDDDRGKDSDNGDNNDDDESVDRDQDNDNHDEDDDDRSEDTNNSDDKEGDDRAQEDSKDYDQEEEEEATNAPNGAQSTCHPATCHKSKQATHEGEGESDGEGHAHDQDQDEDQDLPRPRGSQGLKRSAEAAGFEDHD
ncbi:hypothetical protein AYO20_01688 [Fonsecaea nubica]|uniref:Uncharacterized protein n=1 Tax=Fonsecaea nubica TaxID=856822 RepID=A0A178DBB4_9EURO|nr:hypothetical protein AYO20_01688 [Fonsecaea nubica]OAL38937.1 hypothetical protein AYO20_01688 [Fonsecaea nubica]